jgi:hypothetical protein
MIKHPHSEDFRKAAQLEFGTIDQKGTWELVNRPEKVEVISLKWVFTYKTDPNGYLTKYKARIVIRGDLQNSTTAQDVYATTLASKVFRVLMTRWLRIVWKHVN